MILLNTKSDAAKLAELLTDPMLTTDEALRQYKAMRGIRPRPAPPEDRGPPCEPRQLPAGDDFGS